MSGRARGRWLAASILVSSLGVAGAAPAQDKSTLQSAAEAYDAGLAAHRQKDYARAAALFARADELAPDPAARLAALKSVVLSDDAVLGMTLAERVGETTDASLAEAAKATREKFSGRVGRLRVVCTGCTASLDGKPVAVGADVLVLRGEHVVEMNVEGRVERQPVRVDGEAVVVAPSPPPVASRPPEPAAAQPPAPSRDEPTPRPAISPRPDGGGISPAWFFASAGLTVLAGGLTIASGVDVRTREEDFYDAPTEEKARDGQAAETRTYVLGAVTGAAGLATAALGLFAVRWGDGTLIELSGARGGAALRVGRSF